MDDLELDKTESLQLELNYFADRASKEETANQWNCAREVLEVIV